MSEHSNLSDVTVWGSTFTIDEEIINRTPVNGCVAYFVLLSKNTERGLEIYALLDEDGKASVGKRLEGTSEWKIVSREESNALFADLEPQLKEIACDFLSDAPDKLTGTELRDLYEEIMAYSAYSSSRQEILSFCYGRYKSDKKYEARKRQLLAEIRVAAKNGDMERVQELEEALKELESLHRSERW